jgi:hypothetical protein
MAHLNGSGVAQIPLTISQQPPTTPRPPPGVTASAFFACADPAIFNCPLVCGKYTGR